MPVSLQGGGGGGGKEGGTTSKVGGRWGERLQARVAGGHATGKAATSSGAGQEGDHSWGTASREDWEWQLAAGCWLRHTTPPPLSASYLKRDRFPGRCCGVGKRWKVACTTYGSTPCLHQWNKRRRREGRGPQVASREA